MSKIHWGTNCMDCVEGLKLLKDESIDLTVTSPPYDNLRKYNGYSFDMNKNLNICLFFQKANQKHLIQSVFLVNIPKKKQQDKIQNIVI